MRCGVCGTEHTGEYKATECCLKEKVELLKAAGETRKLKMLRDTYGEQKVPFVYTISVGATFSFICGDTKEEVLEKIVAFYDENFNCLLV